MSHTVTATKMQPPAPAPTFVVQATFTERQAATFIEFVDHVGGSWKEGGLRPVLTKISNALRSAGAPERGEVEMEEIQFNGPGVLEGYGTKTKGAVYFFDPAQKSLIPKLEANTSHPLADNPKFKPGDKVFSDVDHDGIVGFCTAHRVCSVLATLKPCSEGSENHVIVSYPGGPVVVWGERWLIRVK